MNDKTLYLILLEFADKSQAAQNMDGHNAWIDQGFTDDAFLMTGTIPGQGGAVLARNETRAQLQERVERDPFVDQGVVTAELIEFEPSRLHPQLTALLGMPLP